MKLKHRITGTILAIAFATTTVLPAATIPNLKAAPVAVKAPAAPKVPVVKTPTVPKVPVVKVPSAPKIPVVKVPVIPRIVSAPKVPVVKVPVVKVPVAPKAPSIPKVAILTAVKAPVSKLPPTLKVKQAPAAPRVARQSTNGAIKAPAKVAATQINVGKLQNIKERLPVEMKRVETQTIGLNGTGGGGRGSRFVAENFGGSGGGKKPGTIIDSMKANPGTKDRNPASGSPLDNMKGDRNSQVSDGGLPAWMGSKHRNGAEQTNGGGAIVTHGSDGSTTVVKNDTTTTLYKDGTVKETDKNGKTTVYDPAGQPVPDDVRSSGRPVVTKDTAKGIDARKGGNRTPTEESSGSTGPVNTGANGTGKFGSLSQPAGESVSGTRVTTFDANGIQTRIESRINTGVR